MLTLLNVASAALAVALGAVAPVATPVQGPSADTAESRWHVDETFGTDGIVVTEGPVGGYFPGGQILVQPDGKIVVAAQLAPHEITVIRYLPSGELDLGFGHGGYAWAGGSGSSRTPSIALQMVGDQTKIVAVVDGGDRRLDLWRFNDDGTRDSNHDDDPSVVFGKNGHAHVTSPTFTFFSPQLTVGPDGSLYVADAGWIHFPKRPLLLKVLRDGALDVSFGESGFVVLPFRGGLADSEVATADDGTTRILVAGSRVDKAGVRSLWLLAGLTESGEVDPSYGVDGYLSAQPPGPKNPHLCDGEVYRLHPEPSGGVVLDGFSCPPTRGEIVTYARVHPSGHLDTTYDGDGWAYPVEPGTKKYGASRSVRTSDGGMLWAGSDKAESDPMLFGGLLPDGSLDPRFGPNGYLVVELPHFGDDPPENRLDDVALRWRRPTPYDVDVLG